MSLALAGLLPILLQIPMDSGFTVVQSISGDVYQGRDYETVITVRAPAAAGVTLGSTAFVKDRAGERNWLSVVRTVTVQDLSGARALVLGFDTDDAEVLPGTTAIGPSRLVLDDLERTGRASISVRRHASHPEAAGTLEPVGEGDVAFPILLNGVRVEVPALRARGRLGARPWEFWFLDHPVQPLTLKAVQGAEGTADASRPEWSRQIVRIDVLAQVALLDVEVGPGAGGPGSVPPGSGDGAGAGAGGLGAGGLGAGQGAGLGAGARGLESRLADACRVQVPGIYFEFDSDVLNPASVPWVRAVADLLRRHPDWTVTIEGHTDSIGSARYNQDLSGRRAGSLKRSLVGEHGIAAARLATQGFGPDRPLETNRTVEGRARNRRVELVRPC
jgi:outer membrane protein OmpA-like peptidoglycan-associated protein